MTDDLDTDEAIVKLIAFIGACLSTPDGRASDILSKAKKLNEGLLDWVADDSA